jgi:hypothetical protein
LVLSVLVLLVLLLRLLLPLRRFSRHAAVR